MNAKEHWEKVYREKNPTLDVSWYQVRPDTSLRLIQATGIAKDQPVIDVGGGASSLVDCLLDLAFQDLTVLDISAAALEHARRRLTLRAKSITWVEADVTAFKSAKRFQLWHDRAVFHFLTQTDACRDYVRALKASLAPDGWLIMATFAKDGPNRCSGLPVAHYDADTLQTELGREFKLVEQLHETHVTPWDNEQSFAWFCFHRVTA